MQMNISEVTNLRPDSRNNRTTLPLETTLEWTCPITGLPVDLAECKGCPCPVLQMQLQMRKYPRVSIIVPCKEINDQVERCIHSCLALDYPDFEILLLPDELPEGVEFRQTHIIPTGPVKPSVKRNQAVEMATGEICAFLDSDAYPVSDWLKRAIPWFGTNHIDGVGGPNLTPPQQTLLERAGGDVLASLLCSGPFALRYKKAREESFQQELPSCNLLVRRSAFRQLEGFDVTLLTAEDAKLCFMINETGRKVLYSPDVIVYHHRRTLFIPHLRQISRYALDKATLIKQKFSLDKMIYTIPSLFVLGLIFGPILGTVFPLLFPWFVGTLVFYLGLIVFSYLFEVRKWSLLCFALFTVTIPLTHIVYGISFMWGLLTCTEDAN
jgi:cellulose synthase/poly-beta-1,6-N-acetylglucosamine synthase-like glycosyltransferase